MYRRLLSKICKLYYIEGRYYSIPFGPNRGKRFKYHNSINMDMMLGLHEPNTFEAMRQIIQPGMIAIDLGAHRGYFSIYLNELVRPTGRVYAFEPLPISYSILVETLEHNGSANVIPVQKAVSDTQGKSVFYLGSSPYMSSLDSKWAGLEKGAIEVDTVRLDTFIENEQCKPDFIKMDIEGGGFYALKGMLRTIQTAKPYLLLESHTPQEDLEIGRVLEMNNYKVFRIGSSQPITNLLADYRDPNGVRGTVLGIPKERENDAKGFWPEEFQRNRIGQRTI